MRAEAEAAAGARGAQFTQFKPKKNAV